MLGEQRATISSSLHQMAPPRYNRERMSLSVKQRPRSRRTATAAEALTHLARSVCAEMPPEHVAILRALPPGVRVQQGFALWRMARDALIRQGLRHGLDPAEARTAAALRLLDLHDDPPA